MNSPSSLAAIGITPVDPLPAGAAVGSFVLQAPLSDDGFGLRYRATASASAADVTIEEFAPATLAVRQGDGGLAPRSPSQATLWTDGLQAFLQESERMARLRHPCLASIGPYWQARGTVYRLLLPVQGQTLAEARAAMTEPPTEAWMRRFLLQLVDALQRLHEGGGLHGNVQPHSILLQEDGRPILIDPMAVRLAIGARMTRAVAWPQPAFVAAELTAPQAGLPVGPWSDVYALGAVARYCLSGRGPFGVWKAEGGGPRPSGTWSTGLLTTLERACTRDPRQRLQSMIEFRQALDAPAARTPVAGGAGPMRMTSMFAVAPPEPPAAVVEPEEAPREPPMLDVQHEFDREPAFAAPRAAAPASPVAPEEPPMPPLVMHAEARPAPQPRRIRQKSRTPALLGGVVMGVLLTLLAGVLLQRYSEARRPAGLASAPSTVDAEIAARPPAAGPVTGIAATTSAPAASTPTVAPALAATELPPLATKPEATAPVVSAAPPPVVRPVSPIVQPAKPIAEAAPAKVPKPVKAVPVAKAPVATKPAAPQKVAEKLPATPAEACSPRTNFSLYRCMQTQCGLARFSAHPQCVRLRSTDEVPG